MASDLQNASDTSLTSLVSGIINDAQELISQQLALFRKEIQQDLSRTWQAGIVLGLGVCVGLVAGIVMAFALAHLLVWSFPTLPVWGSYAIVGLVLAAAAGALVMVGKQQLDSFNPLPDQSVDALQENVQWLTKPK